MPYLQRNKYASILRKTNIGSRPSKRGAGNDLKFEDLRAIPFVGSWSQLKQNVPGFLDLEQQLKKLKTKVE